MPGWLVRGAIIAAVAAALILGLRLLVDPVHRFEGVEGPVGTSQLASPRPATPGDYGTGSTSALAILLTDPQSPWLGLAFALRSHGVPFVVTQDPAAASRHAVILAYPTLSGRLVTEAAADQLRAHVQAGATLIASEMHARSLKDVFGLEGIEAGPSRRGMRWTAEAAARWGFAEPQEIELGLRDPGTARASLSLRPAGASALAMFDDGSPALLRHDFGKGHAYTLGFDPGAFIASAQQGRREPPRDFVNTFEPAVDVLARWIRAVYREGQPHAVTLGTAPQGRALSVIVSHDVDFSDSMGNSLEYARSEARQKIRATYFVQTKYVRDWNDDRFFDETGLRQIQELHALGGELASHSVAHSPVFAKLPVGTGDERYPAYAPRVQSREETNGASVLGELRVSRFLLQRAAPGAPVDGFRPGHLSNPFALPQALQATGYRSSSALTVGTALTHLPYQLSYNREGKAAAPVFEYPITLEDELVRPMDTALLPKAIDIGRQLARYGGMCMVLIHPNVLEDKLRFQEQFVTAMRAQGAWIGTLGEFASWWTARDAVKVATEAHGALLRVTLETPAAVAGLSLQPPAGWRLQAGAAGREGAHGIVIDVPAGRSDWLLERSP